MQNLVIISCIPKIVRIRVSNYVEDDRDQSLVPQHESAEDYSVTRVEFSKSGATQIYYATPGTQVSVGIDIEVQHDNFSYNLMVRVELRSVADSNSNESESHGTEERTIYRENPYRAFVPAFTLSNDSDGREYFLKISVLLPDDSWTIIYDEKDSSFPDGRLSTKSGQNVDTDKDGLTDGKEVELGTNLVVNDTDNDGLNDSYEVDLGTDPLRRDSNGDGLNDSYELDLGTDPLHRDTDRDGLNDSYEVDLGTDPLHRDTDGDGVNDGDEIDLGRNPRVVDGDTLSYGSFTLFLGIFVVAFFIVTLTRRGRKR